MTEDRKPVMMLALPRKWPSALGCSCAGITLNLAHCCLCRRRVVVYKHQRRPHLVAWVIERSLHSTIGALHLATLYS
jgi:hypothetical protein